MGAENLYLVYKHYGIRENDSGPRMIQKAAKVSYLDFCRRVSFQNSVPVNKRDGYERTVENLLSEQIPPVLESVSHAPNGQEVFDMMTGFSGTSHLGKVYRYYICNGKKDKKCKKKMISKEYIEELVLSECRKVLSPSNIAKISAEVARLCEEEIDTSNVKYLKKILASNERRHKKTIDRIIEYSAQDCACRPDELSTCSGEIERCHRLR